jgi:hypothetical protein
MNHIRLMNKRVRAGECNETRRLTTHPNIVPVGDTARDRKYN